MFKTKKRNNKQKDAFIFGKQYINTLSNLNEEEYQNFGNAFINHLKEIRVIIENIDNFISDIKSLDDFSTEDIISKINDEFSSLSIKSEYASSIIKKYVIIVTEYISSKDGAHTRDILNFKSSELFTKSILEINRMIADFQNDFTSRQSFIQVNQENPEFQETERIYNLYQQFKDKYTSIQDAYQDRIVSYLNPDKPQMKFINADDFIINFYESYISYLNSVEEKYDSFKTVFKNINVELKSLKEEAKSLNDAINSIDDLTISKNSKKILECFAAIITSFFLGDEELAKLYKTVHNTMNYKEVNSLTIELCRKLSNRIDEITNIINSTYEEVINHEKGNIPELQFIKEEQIPDLSSMPYEKIDSLFDQTSFLYMLARSLVMPYEQTNLNRFSYITLINSINKYIMAYSDAFLEYTFEFIEIINELKKINVGIEELKDYIDYFKYIDNDSELSEQDIIDETMKRYTVIK